TARGTVERAQTFPDAEQSPRVRLLDGRTGETVAASDSGTLSERVPAGAYVVEFRLGAVVRSIHPAIVEEFGDQDRLLDILKSEAGENPDENAVYARTELLCTHVRANLDLSDLRKLHPGDGSEHARGAAMGIYRKAYLDEVAPLRSPANVLGRGSGRITPHVDRNWHKAGILPEIFPHSQKQVSDEIDRAIVLAMVLGILPKSVPEGRGPITAIDLSRLPGGVGDVREVWGFWPPVRAGNPVLIRDDLLDLAAQAAQAADHASWALLLVDPATVARLAGGDATGTGPLTRDILSAIRAEKAGVALGRTSRQSADTTRNLYLRRILVVPSDLDENADAVSAAFALVREDLVDNVIFLAAREPRHAERHAIAFAGLRLVETLAAARNVEAWFEGSLGPKQKAVAVMRLTVERSLLATPTNGHRRLAIVQTMIEELLAIEHDGRREAAVRQSADEIAKVRATIAEEGRPAPTGWVEETFGSNRALAGHATRKPGGRD
ncbi:hypothetical protein ACFQ12_15385, partial [Methylobacterium trifolii]